MVDLNSFGGGLAGGAVVGVVIKAYDEYSKELKRAQGDVLEFGKISRTALLGYTTAALGAGIAISKLAVEAAEAGDIQDAFNKRTGPKGIQILNEMQTAVLRTVDKYTLMAIANQSLARGINAESIPTLSLFAMQMKDAGIATGSVANIVDELTGSLATGRFGALKRYGIDAKDAADALGQIAQKTKEMEKPTVDAADAASQLSVAWKELRVALGETFGPAVTSGLKDLAKAINPERGGYDLTDPLQRAIAQEEERLKIIENNARTQAEMKRIMIEQSPALQLLYPWYAKNDEVAKSILYTNEAITEEFEKQNAELAKQVSKYDKLREGSSYLAGMSDQDIAKLIGGKKPVGSNVTLKPRQNDFMMRGDTLVPFSSQDTIIGFKGNNTPGGVIVNINGDINGLNEDMVAQAIQRKLSKALTI